MKRAQKFVKRNWLLETLEHRCLMAADLQIGPLPVFEETIWMQADQVVAFQEDAFPAMVNERIANMEAAAPGNTGAFVRALQESMGLPGFYNNEAALDELYAKYLTATDTQTIVTTSFDVVGVPADFEDTFTVKVNAQIARVGSESPDNLNSFVIALQTTMAGGQASEFINNDIALEELSNQYANRLPPSTLSVPTPGVQAAPLPATKQTADEDEPLAMVTETFDSSLNQMPVAGPINSGKADDQTIIPDSDDARSTEEEASIVSGTLRDELLEKVDEQA